MKVKSESEVAQCPTHSDPMDCSPPGSSVHGIFQARVLEWVAIDFSAQADYMSLYNRVGLRLIMLNFALCIKTLIFNTVFLLDVLRI